MAKEHIADLTSRTYAIAENILVQLNGTKPNFKESFFYGILARQVLLLENITKTLLSNPDNKLTATFILFRCLLDDFITVLYLQSRNFDETDLIKHSAHAYHERFKTIASARGINDKYFSGKQSGLVDGEYEKNFRQKFLDNPENDKYFKNKKKFEFKNFPSITSIVQQLPKTELGKANAAAFILWRHFSHYVHYTMLTFELEITKETREIEIKQLKEALSYCYKTILMSSDILRKWGKNNELKDSTNVWNDING